MAAIHTSSVLVGGAVLLIFLTGRGPATPTSASAIIRDAAGNTIGLARFQPAGEDVKVTVEVRGLTPGAHGIHVHKVGRCEAPSFASAESHFNPAGQPHHGSDAKNHHAGDLPNLFVERDGSGRVEAVLRGITMRGRGHHSQSHLNGTSILIPYGREKQSC
jgi:Cu-Zn family superoxide dismutase